MAASATLALKAGVWFRRGRLVIVSPDSLGTACPLSGRNSTYRPVQISETSSEPDADQRVDAQVSACRTIAGGRRSGAGGERSIEVGGLAPLRRALGCTH